MISFATLLSLAKKRFTRVNKDNDKHKRGTHKCPYMERLHDIKTLYKKSKKHLNWKLKYVKVEAARANNYWN